MSEVCQARTPSCASPPAGTPFRFNPPLHLSKIVPVLNLRLACWPKQLNVSEYEYLVIDIS